MRFRDVKRQRVASLVMATAIGLSLLLPPAALAEPKEILPSAPAPAPSDHGSSPSHSDSPRRSGHSTGVGVSVDLTGLATALGSALFSRAGDRDPEASAPADSPQLLLLPASFRWKPPLAGKKS